MTAPPPRRHAIPFAFPSGRVLEPCVSHRRLSGERLPIHIAQGPDPDLEIVKRTLLANPGVIERGLFVLDAHLLAGKGGLIDLLAVGESGRLAIVEIDRGGEDDLLHRSLAHHGWVGSQMHFLRCLYGAERISASHVPRTILLARRFSPEFLQKIADLPAPLTPMVYRLGADGQSSSLRLERAAAARQRPRLTLDALMGRVDLLAAAGKLPLQELAVGTQRSPMPRPCPPVRGYDIAGLNLPCRAVGGDTYDFLPRPGNRLWVTVGDVAGKGIPAALIRSRFRTMLRELAEVDHPVSRFVARLNDRLSGALDVNQFISFFVMELEPEEGIVRYVNAGHNPPILIRASGDVESLLGSGPVLGVVPGFLYPVREIRIGRGDTLLLYTDGATESQNPGQEEFGEKRLLESLRRVASSGSEAGLAKLEKSILEFCGSAPRYDDITLLLARRLRE